MDLLARYIQDFEAFGRRHPGPISHSVRMRFGNSRRRLLFSALVHGDEVGTLPAMLQMMKDLEEEKIQFDGEIDFVLGNLPAAEKGRRFLEKDLNRVFGLASHQVQTQEEKRAQELSSLVLESKLYLDLHQTIAASLAPFYITAFHESSYQWARLIGLPSVYIGHSSEERFSKQGLCSDEFAQANGVASLSIEFFQKGFSEKAETHCFDVLARAIQTAESFMDSPAERSSAVDTNKSWASFKISHREELQSGRDVLHPNLKNLQELKEGQILGKRSSGAPIRAKQNGILLFPKYQDYSGENSSMEKSARDFLFLIAAKVL